MPIIEIPEFSAGMDYRPAHLIPDNALALLGNGWIWDGILWRDYGYTSGTTITGNISWMDWFLRATAAPVLITGTTTRFYTGTSYTDSTGTALTGASTDQWQAASFNDIYYFTNGKDQVRKWTGSGNSADIAGSPQFTRAKAIATFGARLFVANTTESAVAYPGRVRWSKVNDGDNWTDDTGGFVDIKEASSPIQAMYLLRDNLIVWTRTQIWRVYKTGYPLQFDYELITDNPDLALYRSTAAAPISAVLSIVPVNDAIYYFGQGGIFEFNGSAFRSIGEPIWPYVIDNLSTTVTSNQGIAGGADPARQRILWTIAQEKVIGWSWRHQAWTVPFSGLPLGSGFIYPRAPYTTAVDHISGGLYVGDFNSTTARAMGTTGRAGANFRTTIQTKLFGDATTVKRINRVYFSIKERDANSPLTFTVTGYDDVDFGSGSSGLGRSEAASRSLTLATLEKPWLDFDIFGRWFQIQVQDTNGQQGAPLRLLSGLAIEFEEMGSG